MRDRERMAHPNIATVILEHRIQNSPINWIQSDLCTSLNINCVPNITKLWKQTMPIIKQILFSFPIRFCYWSTEPQNHYYSAFLVGSWISNRFECSIKRELVFTTLDFRYTGSRYVCYTLYIVKMMNQWQWNWQTGAFRLQ